MAKNISKIQQPVSSERERRSEKRKKAKAIFLGAGKVILSCLLVAGVGVVACAAPNIFVGFDRLFRQARSLRSKKDYSPQEKRAIQSMFDYLRRRGYIQIRRDGKQIYISLTKEGKKRAGRLQIDDLQVTRTKQWDGKWRILFFDVPHSIRLSREALRGKLKEMNFVLFQKSVWIHAFPCEKEIEILQTFFGLRPEHVTLITTDTLGSREVEIRKKFGV